MFLKVLWYAYQQNYAVWRFLEAFISNKITRNNSKLCPIPNLHQGIYLLVSLLYWVKFASYPENVIDLFGRAVESWNQVSAAHFNFGGV